MHKGGNILPEGTWKKVKLPSYFELVRNSPLFKTIGILDGWGLLGTTNRPSMLVTLSAHILRDLYFFKIEQFQDR